MAVIAYIALILILATIALVAGFHWVLVVIAAGATAALFALLEAR